MRAAGTLVTILSALIVVACGFGHTIAPERRPSVVGVIADRDVTSTNDLTVRLEDDTVVTLPAASERLTAGSTASPGELLLADPKSAAPWFVSVGLSDDGECYVLGFGLGELRDGRLVLANGLVIPLAPSFDPGPAGADGHYDASVPHSICLNERGEALR